MKPQIIAAWLAVGALQGSIAAQDWSSWITSNNHDVQYRWLGSTPSEGAKCQLQLHDLKWKVNTIASVRINYKYDNAAESTRDVVTITDLKCEEMGGRTIDHCVSVDDLHLNEVVRR
jgi:hypothetical protein